MACRRGLDSLGAGLVGMRQGALGTMHVHLCTLCTAPAVVSDAYSTKRLTLLFRTALASQYEWTAYEQRRSMDEQRAAASPRGACLEVM